MRPLILATLLALGACRGPAPDTLQGYAEGEYVRIAAPFAGTLVQLTARRGSPVAAGAPLFALEAGNETAARGEAEQRVRRAEAQVADLKRGKRPTEIGAVQAQLAQAQSMAALSEKELARQLDLVAKGFVSKQAADEARANRDRDRARVTELQNQVGTVSAGARPDEVRAAEAEAAAAREALAQADWRLRQKSVAASVAGDVVDTLFVEGEWVPAGAPVVTLLPPANRKIRFFVPEERLGGIRPGQPVSAACDGCGTPIAATVSYIAPQAEFTPPVIYSRESRAKLVFLVEARADAADAARLRPGQPLDVTLR